MSPQSVSSLAAFYDLEFVETAERLCTCLKSLGVNFVFDSSIGRNLTLLESGKEFIERFKTSTHLPLFTSSCPGWICYAEKTHGDFILPHISRVKSPQQMMGSLVKRYLSTSLPCNAQNIYHFTVMPCFDKKLEALRPDFTLEEDTNIQEVDCVVATNELLLLILESGKSLSAYERTPFDSLVDLITSSSNAPYVFKSHEGSGSGGYVEYVFKYAAENLFGIQNPGMNFICKRSSDHKELFLTIDGEVKLRFAVANGFKNLGNFAMKLKKKNLKYDYVEIMACPSGCLNGGGQLRSETLSNKNLLKKVEEKYMSLPVELPGFEISFDGTSSEAMKERDQMSSNKFLFAEYKAVPKLNTNSLNIKW